MQQRDAKGRFTSTAQKRNTTTPISQMTAAQLAAFLKEATPATATTDRPTRIVIMDTTDDYTILKALGIIGLTLGL